MIKNNRRAINIIFFLFISLSFNKLNGQNTGVGTWTSHAPFSKSEMVVATKNRIFAAGANSLFYFDQEDNSINKFTKNDGLTGLDITSLAYDESSDLIFVGYKDGNIDIISDNLNVSNFNDIQRTNSVIGSKKINNFSFDGDLVYISTDFGIIVYDQAKQEVKESYRNIGPTGQETIVQNTIIDTENNLVYSHNDFGLSFASRNGNNLLDFQNWTYLTDSTGANIDYFSHYAYHNNQLVAALSDASVAPRNIYKLVGNEFVLSGFPVVGWANFESLKSNHGKLVASYIFDVFVYDETTRVKSLNTTQRINSGIITSDNEIWAVTESAGLISSSLPSNNSLSPSSPSDSRIFNFYSHDALTIGLSGGYNGSGAPTYNGRGLYIYNNFSWTNINSSTKTNYSFADMIDAEYDPIGDRYFFASFVNGMIEWDKGDNFMKLTAADSAGVPFHTIAGQTRITSVKIDDKRNLWITNHRTQGNPPLHKLDLKTNTWQSYNLNTPLVTDALDLVIDGSDQKWILAAGKSIVVYNTETSQEKELNTQPGKGGLPSSSINSIVLDKNDQVWVGTDEGVAVFQDTDQALTNSFYEAFLPIFERRPLLQDEKVNVVAIDGANRKWFGTTNGAFLFNETATEVIQVFNVTNSLLPSNNVTAISVNEKTGEVFFGTENGIASYWGDATEPEPNFSNAKIFPNPINPNFDGVVTINGLKENSTVKITDVTGALIYERDANGGTLTWNTRTLDGDRAQTGVYLVYSTDTEFTESFIGKIVITN